MKFIPEGKLTGFFNQYRYTDALDRLNKRVNGKNSTESFVIWTTRNWNPIGNFGMDFLLHFQLHILRIKIKFFLMIEKKKFYGKLRKKLHTPLNRIMIFSSIMMICLEISIGIYQPVLAFNNNYITSITLNRIIIERIFYIGCYIMGLAFINNRLGAIASFAGFYATGDILLRAAKYPTTYTLFMLILGIFMLFAIFGILISGLRFIFLPFPQLFIYSKAKRLAMTGDSSQKNYGSNIDESLELDNKKNVIDSESTNSIRDNSELNNSEPKKSQDIANLNYEIKKYSFSRHIKKSITDLFKPRIKGLVLLTLLFISMGISYSIISNRDYGKPITIEPQDYQIEFRMWADYLPSSYENDPHGEEMLEQLNKHHVTIQNFIIAIRDADGNMESFSPSIYPEDEQKVVDTLNWWATNYSNVKFQYYAFGLGYQSNGNYEGSIYTPAMLKRFVDICRKYNFSNVVGVYTDWEGPSNTAPKFANETRNGWHQALWTDAMAYAKNYFPNWTFSCCYPQEITFDPIDDDRDLQYYRRYNIFEPMWDDYGGMVYRSCNIEETDPNSYDSSWLIYAQAKALLDGALKGDLSRATMWLGCTGCGAYDNETIVYEHGKPMDFGDGKGFDAFARDILILKHYGFKKVSIFLGSERFVPEGKLTGFFDQYGYADALDRLNETVNGENSTEPFVIWSAGNWNPIGDFGMDFLLNFNSLLFLPVFGLYFTSAIIPIFLLKKKKKVIEKD